MTQMIDTERMAPCERQPAHPVTRQLTDAELAKVVGGEGNPVPEFPPPRPG